MNTKGVNNPKDNYEIIKPIGFDKYGELFLVSQKEIDISEKKLYIMEKIEIKSEKEKLEIINKIEIIKQIDSKYVFKIYELFFNMENEKDFGFIIMDYYKKGNLYKTIIDTNYLNKRTIWRIFIQLTQALMSLYRNNIFIRYFSPRNVYLDDNNNIKIGGDIIFEFKDIISLKRDENINSYIAPEILYNMSDSKDKWCVWPLGCILYELIAKKRAIIFDEDKNVLKNIFEISDDIDEDSKLILNKMICNESYRLAIYEILFEGIVKRKVIELNMFDEVLQNKIRCKYILLINKIFLLKL